MMIYGQLKLINNGFLPILIMIEIIPVVKELWDKQANCAQSSCSGLLLHYNFKHASKILFDSLKCFGGGFGEGMICGAVSGSITALSYLGTTKELSEDKIKELTAELKSKFRSEFEFLDCYSLKKPFTDKITPEMSEGEIELIDQGRRQKCTRMVAFGSNLVEKLINSN